MSTPAVVDAPVWMPSHYTRPIDNPDYSEGEALIKLAEHLFRFEQSEDTRLDDWQKWLIREILQKYPPGHERAGQLVYRQVVVSMGRQNGKTVLGAVFALYGLILMVRRAPDVISIAARVDQAKNLYRKVRFCIETVPVLESRFKPFGRAGIKSRKASKPATYEVKASNGDGLQSFSGCLMLLDELHILKPEAWDALRLGASAQPKALLLGMTTAGDDNSVLLKHLYEVGMESVQKAPDHNPRFGFFLWSADPALDLYDPQALIQANPAIACGRISLEDELAEGKKTIVSEYRRYRRNEFVSVENTWMSVADWASAGGSGIPELYANRPLIISFARTRGSWERVAVFASTKVDDVVYTDHVATLRYADTEWLERVCVDLARRYHVEKFVTDSETMKPVILALGQQHGLEAEYLTRANLANATVAVYAMVKTGRLVHDRSPQLAEQIPKAVTVNSGQGVVLDMNKSIGEIEAVYAMFMGAFIAEQQKEQGLPVTVF
ncbi:terminase large subunit domain-containing protein [Rhodococcus ruber]|uniref:terminase large subunit domain-containing protein n=1 Tax=Rhodococcus ruber TaxID=1830 RepID=UPI003D81A6D3